MKYSLWVFRDWLERNGISLSYQITDNDACIEMIRLDNSPQGYSETCASIVDGGFLPDCSGFRCALCFKSSRILFPVASPKEILNLSLNMMDHYNQWEAALYEQLTDGGSITELLEEAATLIRYPLAFLRPSFTIDGHSSDWRLMLTDRLAEELRRQLKKPQFAFPIYYISDPSSFSGTIIAKPLESGKKNRGQILLYDADGSIRPGDIHLFSAVADLLREAVRFQSDQTAPSSHPLEDWYYRTLFGEKVPELNLSQLELLNWDPDDYFQIACISGSRAKDPDSSSLNQALSGNDYCCLTTPDGWSVLIHLGKLYPRSFGKIPSFLDSYCRKNGLCVGYSLPFRSLTLIREYYQQAAHSLSLCSRSSGHSVQFADDLSDHILKECVSLSGTDTYLHPEIRLLSEVQEQENEPLLETFYTYLICGRSASHASQVLFIHRNTLRARLKRIQSFLSFPIDGFRNVEHILISLMITKIPGRSD